uniref:Uncharacterized protein n=1 Tax=Oryza punctata TaxID=4537 RepID=A0A0E0KNS5_ORYPU
MTVKSEPSLEAIKGERALISQHTLKKMLKLKVKENKIWMTEIHLNKMNKTLMIILNIHLMIQMTIVLFVV